MKLLLTCEKNASEWAVKSGSGSRCKNTIQKVLPACRGPFLSYLRNDAAHTGITKKVTGASPSEVSAAP